MKIRNYISSLLLLVTIPCLMMACGGSSEVDPVEENNAPTSITVTPESYSVTAEGGSTKLSISTPVKPTIVSSADWVSITDGPFNSETYIKTVTVVVAANTEYSERNATVTISASGVADVSFPVKQDAAEEPEEPEEPETPDTPDTPSEPGTGVAWEMAAKLGLGWNMGNHMDAYSGTTPSETVWGNPKCTQATFTNLKKAGFTSVRIPITWLDKIGEAPDYKIDEAWMTRVAEIVGYAENAGLYAIINTHHDECNNDGHWLDLLSASKNAATNTATKAKIKAVWTQIAEKFKDKGDWLIMESFNELQDGGWGWSSAFRANPSVQCNILNEWNQVFVDAVRATGGNNATRWLGVPTYAANPSFVDYFTMPTDAAGKMMLAVHYYDPSDYTIGDAQYSDWGHTGATGKKADYGNEDYVVSTFSKLMTNYVNKGIPVYLGEYGCSMRDKNDSRAWAFYKYYLEYVVKAAKTYGMPAFLWDNGYAGYGKEHHAYINHGTGAYVGNSKEVVDIMVKAMTNKTSTYTLESVYNSAPTF